MLIQQRMPSCHSTLTMLIVPVASMPTGKRTARLNVDHKSPPLHPTSLQSLNPLLHHPTVRVYHNQQNHRLLPLTSMTACSHLVTPPLTTPLSFKCLSNASPAIAAFKPQLPLHPLPQVPLSPHPPLPPSLKAITPSPTHEDGRPPIIPLTHHRHSHRHDRLRHSQCHLLQLLGDGWNPAAAIVFPPTGKDGEGVSPPPSPGWKHLRVRSASPSSPVSLAAGNDKRRLSLLF
ncbi:hypothetical protein BC829DRAFT_33347 [Chytridium lagenaria]|nr:hypothetical protein BC829DRAFT_33347 [Chytridium lagenaria]